MKASKQIIDLAAKLNADIEIWADSENSWVIELTAPDGKEWVESGAISLVSRWWSYAKESKGEAMEDIYNRMLLGLINE